VDREGVVTGQHEQDVAPWIDPDRTDQSRMDAYAYGTTVNELTEGGEASPRPGNVSWPAISPGNCGHDLIMRMWQPAPDDETVMNEAVHFFETHLLPDVDVCRFPSYRGSFECRISLLASRPRYSHFLSGACEDGKEKRRDLAREGGANDVTAKFIACPDQPDDLSARTWLLLSSLNDEGTLCSESDLHTRRSATFPIFLYNGDPESEHNWVCSQEKSMQRLLVCGHI
jgi:hypothetical protein